MTTAPAPNSRTPLLAVQNASQPSDSPRRQSRTAPSNRPPNVPNISFRRSSRRKRSPRPSVFPVLVTCILLIFVSVIAWDISSYGNCYFESVCKALGAGERVDRVWWENAGAYAPWRSVGPGGGKRGLPRGCEINQVTLLHRHGARYPTASAGARMQAVLGKLAKRAIAVPRRRAELAFIAKADLHMKGWKFDHLLNQGRKASWRSGRELRALYETLIDEGEGLFVRASGSDRVVETSGYWLEGFHDQPFKLMNPSKLPSPDLVIPEGPTSNNTLSVHNCAAFNNQSDRDLSGILSRLEPARERLNRLLVPDPLFTLEDMLPLADMCPYDSQVTGEDWEAWSRWCGIFSREEWDVIGHWRDASRYYEVGQGSPYGRTMGAGWASELIARLTDSEVDDQTSTNRTLDANETTFPRGGKRFFVDFGHDNEIVETLAAMGILKQKRDLPTDSIPEKRSFVTSEIIPFGSRIIFERIGCDLGQWEPDPEAPEGHKGDGRKNYIRIFVNDKLVPIHHVLCSQSGFVEHKMCEVDSFLDTQTWATEEVDWDVCVRGSEE